MSYFLTDEQEDELSLFLDRENKKICEEQVSSASDLPDELKEIVKKTIEAGSPIPAFDPDVGYYSVSFTPCSEGNRIYAHHHLTERNEPIFDPLKQRLADEAVKEKENLKPVNSNVQVVPPTDDEIRFVDDYIMDDKPLDDIPVDNYPSGPDDDMQTDYDMTQFGQPPQEILDAVEGRNLDTNND